MLTVPDAARRLGINRLTLYRLCGRGELEHVRIGRSIRIPESALTPKERRSEGA